MAPKAKWTYRISRVTVSFKFGAITDFLKKVHLGDHREIKWDDEIELCADSLYLRLTGKSSEELFRKTPTEKLSALGKRPPVIQGNRL